MKYWEKSNGLELSSRFHRHRHFVAPSPLLRRANGGACSESSTVAGGVDPGSLANLSACLSPASAPPTTVYRLQKQYPRPCADYPAPDEFAAQENRSSQMRASLPAAANLPGPGPLPDAERLRMSSRSKPSGP